MYTLVTAYVRSIDSASNKWVETDLSSFDITKFNTFYKDVYLVIARPVASVNNIIENFDYPGGTAQAISEGLWDSIGNPGPTDTFWSVADGELSITKGIGTNAGRPALPFMTELGKKYRLVFKYQGTRIRVAGINTVEDSFLSVPGFHQIFFDGAGEDDFVVFVPSEKSTTVKVSDLRIEEIEYKALRLDDVFNLLNSSRVDQEVIFDDFVYGTKGEAQAFGWVTSGPESAQNMFWDIQRGKMILNRGAGDINGRPVLPLDVEPGEDYELAFLYENEGPIEPQLILQEEFSTNVFHTFDTDVIDQYRLIGDGTQIIESGLLKIINSDSGLSRTRTEFTFQPEIGRHYELTIGVPEEAGNAPFIQIYQDNGRTAFDVISPFNPSLGNKIVFQATREFVRIEMGPTSAAPLAEARVSSFRIDESNAVSIDRFEDPRSFDLYTVPADPSYIAEFFLSAYGYFRVKNSPTGALGRASVSRSYTVIPGVYYELYVETHSTSPNGCLVTILSGAAPQELLIERQKSDTIIFIAQSNEVEISYGTPDLLPETEFRLNQIKLSTTLAAMVENFQGLVTENFTPLYMGTDETAIHSLVQNEYIRIVNPEDGTQRTALQVDFQARVGVHYSISITADATSPDDVVLELSSGFANSGITYTIPPGDTLAVNFQTTSTQPVMMIRPADAVAETEARFSAFRIDSRINTISGNNLVVGEIGTLPRQVYVPVGYNSFNFKALTQTEILDFWPNSQGRLSLDNIVVKKVPTVDQWLRDLGNTTLPFESEIPTFEERLVRYGYLWEGEYTVKHVNRNTSHEIQVLRSDAEDIHIVHKTLTPEYLVNNGLYTVNGYFHRAIPDDTGIRLLDGHRSVVKLNRNHIGIMSFEEIGELECIPVTDEMISPMADGTPLNNGVYLNIGAVDLTDKQVMLVVGGYLQLVSNIFKPINTGVYKLDLDRLRYQDRFLKSRNALDLSAMDLTVYSNNKDLIDRNELLSDDAIKAYLTHPTSFFVLVETKHLYTETRPLQYMQLPGRYESWNHERLPVFGNTGKLLEHQSFVQKKGFPDEFVPDLSPDVKVIEYLYTYDFEEGDASDLGQNGDGINQSAIYEVTNGYMRIVNATDGTQRARSQFSPEIEPNQVIQIKVKCSIDSPNPLRIEVADPNTGFISTESIVAGDTYEHLLTTKTLPPVFWVGNTGPTASLETRIEYVTIALVEVTPKKVNELSVLATEPNIDETYVVDTGEPDTQASFDGTLVPSDRFRHGSAYYRLIGSQLA